MAPARQLAKSRWMMAEIIRSGGAIHGETGVDHHVDHQEGAVELVGLVAVDQTRGSSHACEAGAQAREVAVAAVVQEEGEADAGLDKLCGDVVHQILKELVPAVNCREGGDPHEVHEGLDEAHEGKEGDVLAGEPGVKRRWQ